ncbi:polysaccharide lyase [Halomontanus rarus]|uniref:polysaccharide lyase n=1 Tax=Halomontanus rarus TaxID=3034020 RepID=UPI0023E81D54|nr:hypothetical protein [Halovivax sp. TS33]
MSFDNNEDIRSNHGTTSIVTDPDGEQDVLEVRYPEGQYYGANWFYNAKEYIGEIAQNAHARYSIYHPTDFEFYGNGNIPGGTKLPGFAHLDEAGWGGRVPNEVGDGWSARGGNAHPDHRYYDDTDGPGIYNQVYHYQQEIETGDHLRWNGELEFGSWNTVDQYISMNDPGEPNGVFNGWIDNELVADENDWIWRDLDANYLGIKSFWWNLYFGGDYGAQQDEGLFFKDLILWFNKGPQI